MIEQFKQEAKELKNILKQYKKTRIPFTDKNFHPNKTIPENRISSFNDIEKWERIDKIYPAPLFQKDLISPDYIEQGQIGDCYFISALSRIAQESHLIPSRFERKIPNKILGKVENSINIECGAVVIFFHYYGQSAPVLIDTLIPMKNNQFIFSRPKDNTKSAWFCLVEKAYAKLKGSYSNIVSGLLSSAIYNLFAYYPTNKKYQDLNTDIKKKKMSVFNRLLKYQNQNAVMSCSINDADETEIKKYGLVTNHDYLIMKVRQIKGNNLICLRNPWGRSDWNGDWSLNSPLWTDEIKKEAGFKDKNNGSFWMCEKDFFKFYNEYSVAKPVHAECISRKLIEHLNPGENTVQTPKYIFQINDDIEPKDNCKIYFVVERQNSCFDPALKKDVKYHILTTQKVDNVKYNFKFTCNSEVYTFTKELKDKRTPLEIFFQRVGNFNYVDDLYVHVFCDYKFELFNVEHPDDLCPQEENHPIVFNNYSSGHPNVAKPIVVKNVNGKPALDFNSSYTIGQSEKDRVKSFFAKFGMQLTDSEKNTSTSSNLPDLYKKEDDQLDSQNDIDLLESEQSDIDNSSCDDSFALSTSSEFEDITSDRYDEELSCNYSDVDEVVIDGTSEDENDLPSDDEPINIVLSNDNIMKNSSSDDDNISITLINDNINKSSSSDGEPINSIISVDQKKINLSSLSDDEPTNNIISDDNNKNDSSSSDNESHNMISKDQKGEKNKCSSSDQSYYKGSSQSDDNKKSAKLISSDDENRKQLKSDDDKKSSSDSLSNDEYIKKIRLEYEKKSLTDDIDSSKQIISDDSDNESKKKPLIDDILAEIDSSDDNHEKLEKKLLSDDILTETDSPSGNHKKSKKNTSSDSISTSINSSDNNKMQKKKHWDDDMSNEIKTSDYNHEKLKKRLLSDDTLTETDSSSDNHKRPKKKISSDDISSDKNQKKSNKNYDDESDKSLASSVEITNKISSDAIRIKSISSDSEKLNIKWSYNHKKSNIDYSSDYNDVKSNSNDDENDKLSRSSQTDESESNKSSTNDDKKPILSSNDDKPHIKSSDKTDDIYNKVSTESSSSDDEKVDKSSLKNVKPEKEKDIDSIKATVKPIEGKKTNKQKLRSPKKEPQFYDEKSVYIWYKQLEHYRAELAKIEKYISKKESLIKKIKNIILKIKNEIEKIKQSHVFDERYQTEIRQAKIDKLNHQLTVEIDELKNLKNKFRGKRQKIISEKRKIKQECDENVLEYVKNKEEQRKDKLMQIKKVKNENKVQISNKKNNETNNLLNTIDNQQNNYSTNQPPKTLQKNTANSNNIELFVTSITPRKQSQSTNKSKTLNAVSRSHNFNPNICVKKTVYIPKYLNRKQVKKNDDVVKTPTINKPKYFQGDNHRSPFYKLRRNTE